MSESLSSWTDKLGMPTKEQQPLPVTQNFSVSDAASKHAVQAFFDCLRAEVQEYGISVSTLSHTFIKAGPTVRQSTTAKSILSGKSTSPSAHKA